MLKFRIAFYATALFFAALVNGGVNAGQLSNAFSSVTVEQLSEAAQAAQTIN